MKSDGSSVHWMALLAFASLSLLLSCDLARASDSQTVITAIFSSSSNVIVEVNVPPGTRAVTLESRQRFGSGTWAPRGVIRLDGSSTRAKFILQAAENLELMRVRSDATETLPASFYAGSSDFVNQENSGSGDATPIMMGAGDRGDSPSPPSTSRDVVESDIYKLRDHTLYFFNQYRGLQIIGLSDADSPKLTGTLALPAAGEEMYLLGQNYVVLLARAGCSYGSGEESQIIIVADHGGSPEVIARLPVPGFIQESRMVGTALYVAAQSYRAVPGGSGSTWEWGSQVVSFDLSDPQASVQRSALWYSGYGNVISATDTYLFVATQDFTNWWQSDLHIIDITNPDGTMHDYDSIRTSGRIQDKFKINYAGAVLTTISEDWHWDSGRRLVTKLETFRLPDPRSLGPIATVKLGELELGSGERLRATRFDGSLAYVVTFFQIDPLWVVDLSDPYHPRIAGELQVPGWSTYIEPLGDRLVTLGVETSRVTVSLFDVHDPSQPALLSKVRLGDNYSWSEANYNEKAFTVLADNGLILVPYSGDTTNGYASRVQLIDYTHDSLRARGVIEHRFQPRRATLLDDRIVSFSGWELLTVDATDRDNPLLRGQLDLAWSVDRVFIAGEFLIEITAGTWGSDPAPTLRVARQSDPDHTLTRAVLTNLPVIGATVNGEHLYVAQSQWSWFYPYLVPIPAGDVKVDGRAFVLSIFSLEQLPDLPLLGQIATNSTTLSWSSSLQPLWPRTDLLVWAGSAPNFFLYDLTGGSGDAPIIGRQWPPYWGGSGGQFIAFDVANASAPELVSEVDLNKSNWWSFSTAFVANGLVYVSHSSSEFIPDPTNSTSSTSGTSPIIWPIGTWVQRSFLDVIDYADASHPTIRKPVNIPGTLSGISHGGALLYTLGNHWTTNWQTAWNQFLDASAYDGVSAYLVDSLALSNTWPHPVLVLGTNIFVGEFRLATNWVYEASWLETWVINADGKFTSLAQTALSYPASLLLSFGDLLVVQQVDNLVNLLDASDAAALRLIGSAQPGCFWPDLNNADANVDAGLWAPLGAYGVWHVPAIR